MSTRKYKSADREQHHLLSEARTTRNIIPAMVKRMNRKIAEHCKVHNLSSLLSCARPVVRQHEKGETIPEMSKLLSHAALTCFFVPWSILYLYAQVRWGRFLETWPCFVQDDSPWILDWNVLQLHLGQKLDTFW